ncbi:MAG TPA: N-acetyl-1-D-myo-inositol-2-amino-2-deoxy-alpha-D-glucopyranoside deacetylase [Actinomycetes bacterium]|nr:N-acetyl-1-D-myo-inositol-2-amino-2-deoxy-alpha-D-glucopyranoside deacetylase [Actinomycetes bacterium]
MTDVLAARRAIFVHAHPDDESIANGATMARYAAEGVHVTLVTCTRGEEGEVLVPALEHLAAQHTDELGAHREQELAAAMAELGVEDHRFLGGAGRYRDSGMMGEPTNSRPDCFWQADVDEAAGHLVAVLREVRPQVLATYNANGGYGHPDHIQAHRVAMRAVELSADPTYRPELGEAWLVAKVYESALPRSYMERGLEAMKASGTDFFGVDSVDDFPFVDPDESVTTRVDARAYEPVKMRALAAHATQVTVDGPFFALSNNVGQEAWGYEFYRLVQGRTAAPFDEDGREDGLFNGLE